MGSYKLLNLMKYVQKQDIIKSNRSHYYMSCPICSKEGYNKLKFYVRKDYSVGWCFHCSTAFYPTLEQVPHEIRINNDVSDEFKLIKLTEYPEYSKLSTSHRTYLDRRNQYIKLLNYAGIYSDHHSLVIPFYLNDELVYYQKRSTNSSGLRYFNPPISDKPIYVPPGMKIGKKLIIVEGVFDALASIFLHAELIKDGYVPVAVLGKTLTDYQRKLILSFTIVDEVVVNLDKSELSLNCICDTNLKSLGVSYIRYVRSDGDDPEEMLNSKRNVKYITY